MYLTAPKVVMPPGPKAPATPGPGEPDVVNTILAKVAMFAFELRELRHRTRTSKVQHEIDMLTAEIAKLENEIRIYEVMGT